MSDNNKSVAHHVQFPTYDTNGKLYYRATTGPTEENRVVKLVKIPDAVIPVIFVPGIMGSNLMNLDNKAVWLGNSEASLLGWITKGPKERKRILNPASVRVYHGGEITNTADHIHVKRIDDKYSAHPKIEVEYEQSPDEILFGTRQSRGWGSIFKMSYGEFLDWLQNALHDHTVAITGIRHSLIDRDLQVELNEQALTQEEVELSYQYCFPVHAFGYNWLASNKDSAIALNDYISTVIANYNARGMKCKKVLLVSHSMGGLVSRECSENTGAQQNILGIVHGVMPSIGAAAAYRRMIAGTDGIAGLVLGGNGREITAVFAQSPGAAQLLPSTEYGVGENGWLNLNLRIGSDPTQSVKLPKSDPFDEIYTNREAWYGLCQDTSINPFNEGHQQPGLDHDWKAFTIMMDRGVKPFVDGLKGKYHPMTYAFYGVSKPTYNQINWIGKMSNHSAMNYYNSLDVQLNPKFKSTQGSLKHRLEPTKEDGAKRTVSVPSNNGTRRSDILLYNLAKEDGDGDGTVPVHSARLPEHCVISQTHFSIEHEEAYQNQEVREFTLRAIIKIMQNIE